MTCSYVKFEVLLNSCASLSSQHAVFLPRRSCLCHAVLRMRHILFTATYFMAPGRAEHSERRLPF